MSHHTDSKTALKEKSQAAMSSVLAAIGLTVFKIIVGITTGSLGILAEAAHSGLDLVAALVTYFAVRVSGKPADLDHRYGHGKIENLSALFETLLLLATCAWIIYEAMERLTHKAVVVEINVWAFIVMFVSIIIDINRSQMLYKVAKKYNSQALEADALHFKTDIWSSAVVILGLILVKAGELFPNFAVLEKADSFAALGVALIVIYVSIELGIRTIRALLDTAPVGMADKISSQVNALPGVENCHNIRIRYSGPYTFVDIHVFLDGDITLKAAHDLTILIENTIREIAPGADVTVHPEPLPLEGEEHKETSVPGS